MYKMLQIVEWLVFLMQCVLLLCVTNIASILEKRLETTDAVDPAIRHRHWMVHVVRDTDIACTPCVVVMQSGHLVELDTDVHAALLAASESHDTEEMLAGDCLHDADNSNGPIVQLRYSRTVHHGTRREKMQQVLDTYKCDLVPVHDDAPSPCLVLHDAHAVLGILLARHQPIQQSLSACVSTRPPTVSPQKTPTRSAR